MRRREIVLAFGLAALARPKIARPQQAAGPRVGFIHGSAPIAQYNAYIAAFLDGLKEEGFDNKQNISVEYRWAEGKYERVPTLVAELLAPMPKIMVAYGPPNLVRAAIDAMPREMPMVFGTGGDPVASGIVASLARPGGNATDVANPRSTSSASSCCAI